MHGTLRVAVRGLSLLALWTAAACGGDKPSTPVGTKHDAGKPMADAGFDAGDIPLPREDAGQVDAARNPEPGLMGNCAIDANKIYTLAKRDQPFLTTPLAVDPVNSSFVVPYVAQGDCLDAVHMAQLGGAAASGGPQNGVVIDECSLVRDAAATAIDGHWLMALVDNRMPPYDLWVEPYDATTKKMGVGQRITQGSSVETAIAIGTLRNQQHAMLAYSDEDNFAGQSLYTRPIGADGKPEGEAVLIESSKTLYYRGLVVTQLGADGAALAYVRYSIDYTTSDIVFVALDATGKPLRAPWVLAGNAGPSPSVDMDISVEGGGIVFARGESETGRQLWFQQVDDTGQAPRSANGQARAPSLRFVNAPFKGIDVSITKLRLTYGVAYRALPSANRTRAEIRLYFLDRYGAVIGDSDVSYTSPSGGRTSIKTSYDGRIVIGWSEVGEDGKSVIKAVRLPCIGGG